MGPFPPTNIVFHDPGIHAREQARIFARSWTFLLYADQLPRTGAYRRPSALGEVVVRDDTSGARAFLATGEERPVEWIGRFAFVWLGAQPPTHSAREELGDMAAIVEGLSRDAAEALFEVRMSIAGNWKLVVSGAIEDYHIPFVHGRSVSPWRAEPARPVFYARGHSSYRTPAAVGPGLRALHWGLAGTPAKEAFENILVYPNLLLIRLWGLVHVTLFVPQGPDRTLRITRLYSPAPTSARRPLRAAVSAALRLGIQKTFREDQAIVEEAHAGTWAGRHLPRGPSHEEEARVEHFLAETERRLVRA